MEHSVAGLALEAPDVPLSVQGDERLALLELLVAARALVAAAQPQPQPQAGGAGRGAAGRHAAGRHAALPHGDLHAARAQHLLACVRHPLAGRKRLAANTTTGINILSPNTDEKLVLFHAFFPPLKTLDLYLTFFDLCLLPFPLYQRSHIQGIPLLSPLGSRLRSLIVIHYGMGDHHVPAAAAGEALLVVGVAQGRHHFALHVLAADGALGPKLALVVRRAVVGAILAEEAALR